LQEVADTIRGITPRHPRKKVKRATVAALLRWAVGVGGCPFNWGNDLGIQGFFGLHSCTTLYVVLCGFGPVGQDHFFC